jgi:hypothetical protein
MFAKLQEKEHVFECERKTNCRTYIEKDTAIPLEILEKCGHLTEEEKEYELGQLIQNTQCVQVLRLKKGASVMCTVNLDLDAGICNGSQGIVIDILGNGFPLVRFANGLTRMIQPQFRQSEEYPSIAIGYIPLCLAWAITIHKIQGATLGMAEIDVGGSVFEYGQTYVALSRIQSLDGLYLSSFHPQKIKAHHKVVAFYNNMPNIDYIAAMELLNNTADFDTFKYVEPVESFTSVTDSKSATGDSRLRLPSKPVQNPNVKTIRL